MKCSSQKTPLNNSASKIMEKHHLRNADSPNTSFQEECYNNTQKSSSLERVISKTGANDVTTNLRNFLDAIVTQEMSSPSGDNFSYTKAANVDILPFTRKPISENRGMLPKASKKARLFEICAANSWKFPVFECVKEEGPSHLKLFTFKTTVEIVAVSITILECFGNPRPKKNTAEEDATEGALWYLQQEGYLNKYK